jgi:DNA-directed RNA polymerase specialized sigma24 family protein
VRFSPVDESERSVAFGKREVSSSDRPGRLAQLDPVDAVALVARSRRELLLAAHRHRLTHEDLEDCYSQATLELLKGVRSGVTFSGRSHIANALEQRFLSRIHDRRRALSGRSPIEAAMALALPLAAWEGGGVEVADARADVERLALLRHDLRLIGRLALQLSPDQRLVLTTQLSGDMKRGEFCRTHGWSAEKYRKVAQRARARLALLLANHNEMTGGRSGGSSGSLCPAISHPSD